MKVLTLIVNFYVFNVPAYNCIGARESAMNLKKQSLAYSEFSMYYSLIMYSN